MAKSIKNNAETTIENRTVDMISDLLRSLQIAGTMLLNECYMAPWAISIPNHKILAEKLSCTQGTRIVAYHLVQRGSIEIELENGLRDTVYECEMVICYSGQAHTISQGTSSPAHPFETIMLNRQNIFQPTKEQELHSTSLLCGVFQLQHTTRNPLFEALPAVLKLSTKHTGQHLHTPIKTIIQLLLDEVKRPSYSHEYMVGRYLELLCASSVSSYIESNNASTSGWLRAVKDPMAAKVISAIHSHPDYQWSVAALAELSHLSPSRFAARFSQILGVSPMTYVTQWRMYLAGKLLLLPQSNIEKITSTMGYENVAAFSRAFKRTMGVSPGVWRANSLTIATTPNNPNR